MYIVLKFTIKLFFFVTMCMIDIHVHVYVSSLKESVLNMINLRNFYTNVCTLDKNLLDIFKWKN